MCEVYTYCMSVHTLHECTHILCEVYTCVRLGFKTQSFKIKTQRFKTQTKTQWLKAMTNTETSNNESLINGLKQNTTKLKLTISLSNQKTVLL